MSSILTRPGHKGFEGKTLVNMSGPYWWVSDLRNYAEQNKISTASAAMRCVAAVLAGTDEALGAAVDDVSRTLNAFPKDDPRMAIREMELYLADEERKHMRTANTKLEPLKPESERLNITSGWVTYRPGWIAAVGLMILTGAKPTPPLPPSTQWRRPPPPPGLCPGL